MTQHSKQPPGAQLEASAPPQQPKASKKRTTPLPNPVTLDALVNAPTRQLKSIFTSLRSAEGKKQYTFSEPQPQDVQHAIDRLHRREDGLSHTRRMLIEFIRLNTVMPALKDALLETASGLLKQEFDLPHAPKLDVSLPTAVETVSTAWDDVFATQKRLRAAQATSHQPQKKQQVHEAENDDAPVTQKAPAALERERVRELLILWIEMRYVEGRVTRVEFLECLSALQEPGVLQSLVEPNWPLMVESLAAAGSTTDLIAQASTIHNMLRRSRVELEHEKKQVQALQASQTALEQTKLRLHDEVQRLQQELEETQELNRLLRIDMHSAGNLSLSALQDTRARMRGFLDGQVMRYLGTALDAARSEPPRPRVITERLEIVIEEIQGQLDWLASQTQA